MTNGDAVAPPVLVAGVPPEVPPVVAPPGPDELLLSALTTSPSPLTRTVEESLSNCSGVALIGIPATVVSPDGGCGGWGAIEAMRPAATEPIPSNGANTNALEDSCGAKNDVGASVMLEVRMSCAHAESPAEAMSTVEAVR